VDELLPLVKAVTRGARTALVVADLPFGSYQTGPEQALTTAFRFMKEAGAHAVKLEGGTRFVPQVDALVGAGIPVMAHLGFTPQSEHALGGFRVQGRGDADAQRLLDEARRLEDAGAFAVVLELVPAELAARVTEALSIPTIGIGAGARCDGQVLVLPDLLGLNDAFAPKFLKRYGTMAEDVRGAVRRFADDVRAGTYPDADHSF
jgi:3-methyl-2-oxobutanoate hydroxymethyltransferase